MSKTGRFYAKLVRFFACNRGKIKTKLLFHFRKEGFIMKRKLLSAALIGAMLVTSVPAFAANENTGGTLRQMSP